MLKIFLVYIIVCLYIIIEFLIFVKMFNNICCFFNIDYKNYIFYFEIFRVLLRWIEGIGDGVFDFVVVFLFCFLCC